MDTFIAIEPGLVTLAKILGVLLFSIGAIPVVFLLFPGDKSEPRDTLSGEG
jgi:hypothetical protein